MTYEPRVGDVIVERQHNGRERRIDGIYGDRVVVTGIESGVRTSIKLDNVRRRYRLAEGFNRR
jgi:predicted RNA-binding protein with TRAM domain